MKVVKIDRHDINRLVRLIVEADKSPEEWEKMMNQYKSPKNPDLSQYRNKSLNRKPADQSNNTPQPQQNDNTPQPQQNDELSNKKGELIKQAVGNINQMLNDPDVGLIVSLFVIILTSSHAKNQINSLSHMYQKYIDGGGKDLDFTKTVTSKLFHFSSNIVDSIADLIDKKGEMLSEADNTDNNNPLSKEEIESDIENNYRELRKMKEQIKSNPDLKKDSNFIEEYKILEDSIREAKDQLKKLGVNDYSKSRLKQIAINRIKEMTSNEDVLQVFSMFLYYLTDKDTITGFRRLGKMYSKQLNQVFSDESTDWLENSINQIQSQLKPMISIMSKSVADELKLNETQSDKNTPDKTQPGENQPDQQFKQDQAKIGDMLNRYNLK